MDFHVDTETLDIDKTPNKTEQKNEFVLRALCAISLLLSGCSSSRSLDTKTYEILEKSKEAYSYNAIQDNASEFRDSRIDYDNLIFALGQSTPTPEQRNELKTSFLQHTNYLFSGEILPIHYMSKNGLSQGVITSPSEFKHFFIRSIVSGNLQEQHNVSHRIFSSTLTNEFKEELTKLVQLNVFSLSEQQQLELQFKQSLESTRQVMMNLVNELLQNQYSHNYWLSFVAEDGFPDNFESNLNDDLRITSVNFNSYYQLQGPASFQKIKQELQKFNRLCIQLQESDLSVPNGFVFLSGHGNHFVMQGHVIGMSKTDAVELTKLASELSNIVNQHSNRMMLIPSSCRSAKYWSDYLLYPLEEDPMRFLHIVKGEVAILRMSPRGKQLEYHKGLNIDFSSKALQIASVFYRESLPSADPEFIDSTYLAAVNGLYNYMTKTSYAFELHCYTNNGLKVKQIQPISPQFAKRILTQYKAIIE